MEPSVIEKNSFILKDHVAPLACISQLEHMPQ